jgi:nucleoside-diphosphate-sugar epimerase
VKPIRQLLVTGGAGYVGAVLVPKLLAKGYRVRVIDLYMYGDDVLAGFRNHPALEQIRGDIRDQALLRRSLASCDAVIHLACISNDPSFELNPQLSCSINYDAFKPLVEISKEAGVRRFVYVSTCSVYGISDTQEVTEDHPLIPITDYNKYKAMCEPVLLDAQSHDFTTLIIRPATVCGYSPRQRLDLTVNILTNHAVNMGKITVFGGEQTRPNIHIEDIVSLYVQSLEFPDQQIAGKVYNAGWENLSIAQIAQIVRDVVSHEVSGREQIEIVTIPSDDKRSYRICSERIKRELGFIPKHTVADAVRDLVGAFGEGKIPRPMEDARYYNIKTMQSIGLE